MCSVMSGKRERHILQFGTGASCSSDPGQSLVHWLAKPVPKIWTVTVVSFHGMLAGTLQGEANDLALTEKAGRGLYHGAGR
jgi:hypothetical protein